MKENQKKAMQNYFKQFRNKKLWIWFGIELLFAGLYLAFDLLTKEYIYGTIERTGQDMVIWDGVIRFTAVRNTGASFGAFSNGTAFLTAISCIAAIALLFLIAFTLPQRNGWLRASLVLMFAGGVGNLVDRFAFGFVRDFFYFELIDFAVFNFADSALTVGAICLIIYVFFYYGRKKNEDTTAGSDIKDKEESGVDSKGSGE